MEVTQNINTLVVKSIYDEELGWTVARNRHYYNSRGWSTDRGKAQWFKDQATMVAHMTKINVTVEGTTSFEYKLMGTTMIVIVNGLAQSEFIHNVQSDEEAKQILLTKYGVKL